MACPKKNVWVVLSAEKVFRTKDDGLARIPMALGCFEVFPFFTAFFRFLCVIASGELCREATPVHGWCSPYLSLHS